MLKRRPALERARELLSSFCEGVRWLAALAGEGNVFEDRDPEDEQLLRAMRRFGDGEMGLLTSPTSMVGDIS